MKFTDLQRKLLIGVGLALAFLVPLAIRVLNLQVPVEFLFALIMMYLVYVVSTLINTKEEIEGDVGKIVLVEAEIEGDIGKICRHIEGSGVELITPDKLYSIKERVDENKGDIWFFNIPLGRIRTDEGFEFFIGAAARNPYTKNIIFILNKSVAGIWTECVQPKINVLKTNTNITVKWMTTEKHLAFMFLKGSREVFIFFLEEPFIVETPKGAQTMAWVRITQRPDFLAKFEEIFEKNLLSSES
jgi:hypothetical protein